jgi:hypothetical protein
MTSARDMVLCGNAPGLLKSLMRLVKVAEEVEDLQVAIPRELRAEIYEASRAAKLEIQKATAEPEYRTK